jgi:oligopeptide/dipeptide ABC transporter ATP-binding protein
MLNQNDLVLEVKDLRLDFNTYRGAVKALNGVNFKLYKHEVLSLVGESGCGKSVTALTMINLLPENAEVKGGEILFKGENLLKKSKEQLRIMRVEEFATVFQDPMTFLNPVLTIETQLEEAFILEKKALKAAVIAKSQGKDDISYSDYLSMKGKEDAILANEAQVSGREMKKMAQSLCADVLRMVKLPDPERILRQYPFELSGGMRQRCMIAMALARRPSLFIADEITTALDVTIQAQILHLMRELRDTIDASTLMITHDLAVAAEIANRIAVMYAGNVVELAETREIFKRPLHPYTQLLMKAIPNVTRPVEKLESIPGTVPDLINPPSGCRFHPRCPYAMDICPTSFPGTTDPFKEHEVACYLYPPG